MVAELGMSEALGSVRYAGPRLQYLGSAVDEGDGSAATRELIDAEVRRIISEQYERATALLAAHRDALARLSRELLNTESLDGSAVHNVLPRMAHEQAS